MFPFQLGFLHLAICLDDSSLSFHGFIAAAFFTLNNIPLPGWTRVYLSILPLKDTLAASRFWQF